MFPDNPTLVFYPDDILKTKCDPVDEFNENLKTFCLALATCMWESKGAGIAAPQVGVKKRIIVVTNLTPEEEVEHVVMINPELLPIEEGYMHTVLSEEGCLSFPGLVLGVFRNSHVLVKYQDVEGEEQRLAVGGFLSCCIQHEIDHLDGIPFVYRVPRQQRRAALKQLKRRI